MDRWPMELFEQLAGIGAEKSDLAAAWQDFRYARMRRDRADEGGGAADRAAKAYAAATAARGRGQAAR